MQTLANFASYERKTRRALDIDGAIACLPFIDLLRHFQSIFSGYGREVGWAWDIGNVLFFLQPTTLFHMRTLLGRGREAGRAWDIGTFFSLGILKCITNAQNKITKIATTDFKVDSCKPSSWSSFTSAGCKRSPQVRDFLLCMTAIIPTTSQYHLV
ncbi:hypothetical protein BO71DRAFT_55181 [Aspergillus ellipticus CBS 707.79]|uniref:Uncharacterized protein n=1 Tax=Aspergillus ellipticus CBS 707.79 TaxID=1448320 RepID=A0A319D144_9EURO|nr:hypothetical protein BO71DRAFT_55181 [Aspergillus ellipticus CBS 707.79]